MLRRDLFRMAAMGAAAATLPSRSWALSGAEAEAFVRATVDEVLQLAEAPGDPASKAPQLQQIMERRAAVDQLARFAAGPAWRRMNDGQKTRYLAAFSGYFARLYSRRFGDIENPTVTIDGSRDVGAKGVLVLSRFVPTRGEQVKFEWLVSDRTGDTLVSDIIVEGVSTAVTQQKEIAALVASSSSIDAFIDRLETA